MSNMKCPFCQQELLLSSFRDGDKDNEIWNCLHCQIGGKRKLWQELIGTRKALDVAVDVLKLFYSGQYTSQPDAYGLKIDASCLAHTALAEITALTKGDNNEMENNA